MSFERGMAAIRLEAPNEVPRTEYSAHNYHWGLVQAVTGIEVNENSPADLQNRATEAFVKAWDYDIVWHVMRLDDVFGRFRTRMGHASFAAGNADFDTEQSCSFEDEDAVLAFDPCEMLERPAHAQLVEMFDRDYDMNCRRYPDAVNMTGTYITLVSGLIDLLGWDMLLATAGYDMDEFGALANRYAEWMMQYMRALADCKSPVIMLHDDIVWTDGPFMNPDWYRKYVFPNLKRYIDVLKSTGKKVLFTSDGNFTTFLEDVARAGADGFVMEPCTDMERAARLYGKSHVLVGNADTRILLQGSRAEITAEVQRCMDIGKPCPGFIMAVGNHIPANTPVDNALFYNQEYNRLRLR